MGKLSELTTESTELYLTFIIGLLYYFFLWWFVLFYTFLKLSSTETIIFRDDWIKFIVTNIAVHSVTMYSLTTALTIHDNQAYVFRANADLFRSGIKCIYSFMFPKQLSTKRVDKLPPCILRCYSSLSSCSIAWWRHQMETFSALLAICAGNSPVPGEFPTQRPVTRSFGVNFDLRLNKRLCKQSWGWWFETLLCLLWRHSNGLLLWVENWGIRHTLS